MIAVQGPNTRLGSRPILYSMEKEKEKQLKKKKKKAITAINKLSDLI